MDTARLSLAAALAVLAFACNDSGPTLLGNNDDDDVEQPDSGCSGCETADAGAGHNNPLNSGVRDTGTEPTEDLGDGADTGVPSDASGDMATNSPDADMGAILCSFTSADRFVEWHGTGLDVGKTSQSADFSAGLAAGDIDGDGDPDVVTTAFDGTPKLFVNDGTGNFTRSMQSVFTQPGQGAFAPVFVDIDGDFDLDLFVAGVPNHKMLINDGAGMFSDETSTWHLDDMNIAPSFSAAFADFDNDGDLDLFDAVWRGDSVLYRNDGGFMTPITVSPGGGVTASDPNAILWWDFDADGDVDLFSANDFGPTLVSPPNQLFRNDGADPNDPNNWLFTNVAANHGFDAEIFAMGVGLGDIDNDLDFDLYVTNFGYNLLLVTNGLDVVDEARQRGAGLGHLADPQPRPATPPELTTDMAGFDVFYMDYFDVTSAQYVLTGWETFFFDANHDGWLDLYVAEGYLGEAGIPEAPGQPNHLLLNDGTGNFDEQCDYYPDARGSSRAAIAVDLDLDGDLDIVYSDDGVITDGEIRVMRNDDGNGDWLIVDLVGSSPNTEGIGATVTIAVGGQQQIRYIRGGGGFLSATERIAHFGLGAAATVDSIEVEWPDGTKTTMSQVSANQRVTMAQ